VERAFELQGHRGARGLFPENTLEGFAATMALGVTSVELDVAVTADDVAVVVHDPVLNADLTRDTSGAWLHGAGTPVRQLRYDELLRFDVGRIRPGSALAARHPRQIGQDGLRIPTLDAVLRASAGSGVVFDVELKTDPAQPALTVSPEAMADCVIAVARAAAALDRLVVRSFDWRGLAHLRRVAPNLRLAWLTEDAGAGQADRVAEAAQGCPFQPVWAPHHADLTRDGIVHAQALGLRVVPWTVNHPADMARLIAWGVDGLCTDEPDRAREVMAQSGLALPPSWPARATASKAKA
jgi:glycerophosphoryl diester phosphodiesterase